jgi:elongation factor P
MSGNQTEVRYASGDELEEANARTTPATYLYNDATGFHFMMSDSYEEITLQPDLVGENSFYLQEQMGVELTLWEGEPIGIQLPSTVTLTIVETSPEIRGATASNSPKPAKTETGLSLNVPPFIKQGERVLVRTEDGAYIGRAD